MKIEFEKTDRKYIFIGLLIIGFIVLSAFQYLNNRGLKADIKKRNKENTKQKGQIEDLLISVDVLEQDKKDVLQKADSFEIKEKYYKNKYYVTNEKLKNILGNYNSSTVDDKNKLFTGSLSN